MANALNIVGKIWCYSVCLVILISLAMIFYRDGIYAAINILSPFNIANVVVTALALAPGLLCLWAAKKI